MDILLALYQKKVNWVLTAGIFFAVEVFIVLIPELPNLYRIFLLNQDWVLLGELLLATMVGAFSQLDHISAGLLFFVGLFFSVHVTLLVNVYQFAGRIRMSFFSLFLSLSASIFGGVGCVACGALAVYGASSVFALLGGLVLLLPLGGQEFYFLGIGSSIFGSFFAIRALRKMGGEI